MPSSPTTPIRELRMSASSTPTSLTRSSVANTPQGLHGRTPPSLPGAINTSNEQEDHGSDNTGVNHHHQQVPINTTNNFSAVWAHHKESQQLEQQRLGILLRLFGRAYLTKGTFYWCTFPVTVLVGAAVGVLTFLFLVGSQWLLQIGVHYLFWGNNDSDGQSHPPSGLGAVWSSVMIVLIATGAGKVSGLLLTLFVAPPRRVGMARSFFHDLVHLQTDFSAHNWLEPIYMILSGFLLLAAGAPVSPEIALATLGTALVAVCSSMARALGRCFDNEHDDGYQPQHRPPSHVRRMEACWVQGAIAGALGSAFFPSPIAAVLMVQELAHAGRPLGQTVDATLVRQQQQQQEQEVDEDGDSPTSHHHHHTLSVPTEADLGTFPLNTPLLALDTASLPRPSRRRWLSALDHDVMETMLLSGTAAIASYVMYQLLWKWTNVGDDNSHLDWFHYDQYRNILAGNGSDSEDCRGTQMNHWAVAVLLGVFGGMVGSLTLVLTAVFRWMRWTVIQCLVRRTHRNWVGPLLMALVAGLLVGLLSLLAGPVGVGSGSDGMLVLLRQYKNGNHPALAELATKPLLLMALWKVLGLSVALGLGGFVGGPILPLAFVGVCLGLALSMCGWLGRLMCLPVFVTVPCCIASTIGAVAPVPFTIVLTLSHLFSLSVEEAGPVFVAAVVGHAVTGGLGWVRYCGKLLVGPETYSLSAEEAPSVTEHQSENDEADAEYLRGVRSAIFGGII